MHNPVHFDSIILYAASYNAYTGANYKTWEASESSGTPSRLEITGRCRKIIFQLIPPYTIRDPAIGSPEVRINSVNTFNRAVHYSS